MQLSINDSGSELLIQISDHIISGKSPEQVFQQWYGLWDCYKACCHWAKHTGGGDGNIRRGESSLQSEEGENEDGHVMGVGHVDKTSCKKMLKWPVETWRQYSQAWKWLGMARVCQQMSHECYGT